MELEKNDVKKLKLFLTNTEDVSILKKKFEDGDALEASWGGVLMNSAADHDLFDVMELLIDCNVFEILQSITSFTFPVHGSFHQHPVCDVLVPILFWTRHAWKMWRGIWEYYSNNILHLKGISCCNLYGILTI